MELSERERRLLQEMESHLLVEDPGLASSLSVHRLRVGARAIFAVSGVPIGALLMGLGVWRAHRMGIAIAMVGFVVLLASTSMVGEFLRARRRRRPLAAKAAGRARRASS